MKRPRNLVAHEAWMAQKRAGRPRQFWVGKGPGSEDARVGHWAKSDSPDPGQRLLLDIFGGVS